MFARMLSLFAASALFSITFMQKSYATDMQSNIGNTVMIIDEDTGGMASIMTGGVLNLRDENGFKYIITARHGIIDPTTGVVLAGKDHIQIRTFEGDELGTAQIGYCDTHRDARPGEETNEYNVIHDVCVLKMIPAETKKEYRSIRGYILPSSLGSGIFSLCHDGLASWDKGASGSPLFTGNGIFQGVLSATYNEKSIPESDWKKMLTSKGVAVPSQLFNLGHDKPVVVSSCAVFVPPTPEVLAFMGVDPQKVNWIDAPVPDGTPWGSLSIPVFRPVYIWDNQTKPQN